MPGTHALLSASSSHRWLKCTPSAVLESKEPEQTSPFAEEGTKAHELSEQKLKYWLEHPRGKKKFKGLDGEMDECSDQYRDYVIEVFNSEKKKTPDAQLLVEQRLDFSEWVPDGFGTGDAVVVGDDTLHVIDLKYGKGVPVAAEGNTQARLYAVGAANRFGMLYEFDKVKVHIFQPRIDNTSSAEYTVEELIEWATNEVAPKAKLAYEGLGEFHPAEDTCRFCKLRGKCLARMKQSLTSIGVSGYPEAPATLSKEKVELALPLLEPLISWAKDLQEYALGEMLKGEKYRGFKLVEGRSLRKITDPEEVRKILNDKGYTDEKIMKPQELKPITALEKEVGKKDFNEFCSKFIVKPAGKPTMVPSTDKREEYKAPEVDFAEELKTP